MKSKTIQLDDTEEGKQIYVIHIKQEIVSIWDNYPDAHNEGKRLARLGELPECTSRPLNCIITTESMQARQERRERRERRERLVPSFRERQNNQLQNGLDEIMPRNVR